MAEVRRLVEAGYVTKYDSWDTVTWRAGGGGLVGMAFITKVWEDASVKVRLIIDMRRSGVNKSTEESLEDVKELLESGGSQIPLGAHGALAKDLLFHWLP
eukprot:5975703-Amphidinium_carterae.2